MLGTLVVGRAGAGRAEPLLDLWASAGAQAPRPGMFVPRAGLTLVRSENSTLGGGR